MSCCSKVRRALRNRLRCVLWPATLGLAITSPTWDSRLDLLGKWIIEISELAGMRRAENEKVKAFVTARVDHFRPPYGRRAVDVPRQNVFAASTNDNQPFVDSTGNRRFWPVRCGPIDVDAIIRDRDQLWAEAYHGFKEGENWWLDTAELNMLAEQEQEQRYEDGVWDNLIIGSRIPGKELTYAA